MEDNYIQPNIYRPRGNSGTAQEDAPANFAGLGGSFAGPMGDFTARFLQARLSGMNRATVDPRINQRRVMASPEFALAKALGISTPYNSGGRQVDVARMEQRAQSPSMMERDFANAKLKEFNERNAGVELNPAMAVAGLGSMQDAIPSERPSVSIPTPQTEETAPAQRRPMEPYKGPTGTPATPGPSAPQGAEAEKPGSPTADPRKPKRPGMSSVGPTIRTTGRIA